MARYNSNMTSGNTVPADAVVSALRRFETKFVPRSYVFEKRRCEGSNRFCGRIVELDVTRDEFEGSYVSGGLASWSEREAGWFQEVNESDEAYIVRLTASGRAPDFERICEPDGEVRDIISLTTGKSLVAERKKRIEQKRI